MYIHIFKWYKCFFPISYIYTAEGDDTCTRSWKKIGCYHDQIFPSRPFPDELLNNRDIMNNNWGRHLTNWTGFSQSLHT